MEVIFKAPQKLGNRFFDKGKRTVPDHMVHNMAFKKLVASGMAQVVPRDAAVQKIQMSKDIKALKKARHARHARKALQSAQAASSATPNLSSAVGSVQALPTPAKPVKARTAAKATAPAVRVTAPKEGDKD